MPMVPRTSASIAKYATSSRYIIPETITQLPILAAVAAYALVTSRRIEDAAAAGSGAEATSVMARGSGPLSLRERVRVRGRQEKSGASNGIGPVTPPHPGPLPEGEGARRPHAARRTGIG